MGPLGSGWGPRTVANVPVITAPLCLFSSVWLGCRESTKAADDDYNYALEWLIRALGYALEVPDSCFDGLWDFLTSPRLIPGLRYRDAYDACVAAGLPVALISVIVCEARLPSSARRAFAPPPV